MALVPVLLHCDQPGGNLPTAVVSNDSSIPREPVGAKRDSNSSSRRRAGWERRVGFFIELPVSVRKGGWDDCSVGAAGARFTVLEHSKDLLRRTQSLSSAFSAIWNDSVS